MGKNLNINVHHVTRLEGHGNIVVRASDGKVEQCMLEIVETPRVFESMIRGLPWPDTSILTGRICGICSVGHTTASVKATDDAFGVKITPEVLALRKLLLMAEEFQSHVLHVYFLAAPDAFGAPSVIPLAATHPEVVTRALRMKKMGNVVCEMLAGRHVHPISLAPGGWLWVPPKANLLRIKEYLELLRKDVDVTVETVASIAGKFPRFERPREDLSLTRPDEYAFYDGNLKSSKAGVIDYHQYLDFIHEKCVKHSTSKHVHNVEGSLAVGALSRFNNNDAQLCEKAKSAAKALGLKAPCYNPYYNNLAQTVEIVQAYEESLRLIDQLLGMTLTEATLAPSVKPRAGRGVGLVEVPRGLLVHDYAYDEKGVCAKANCVIPTGMNLGNIDADMRKYVPEVIEKRTQDQIAHDLEMLVRSYDPCISCSVHRLKVKWV